MPAGSHCFQVGELRCTVLSDGYAACPTAWFFPNADRVDLARALHKRGLPQERVLNPYSCLLVETGRHVVLADTGLGTASSTSGAVVARLEAAGIRRQDVDTVIFTHAHPDHIGGALDMREPRRLAPVFPNAHYVMSEAEWDFWTGRHVDLRGLRVPGDVRARMESTAKRCLLALRHQVELIGGEADIVPGVRAIPAPGHTPGHMALVVASGGRQMLNLGDAAAHPLHLEQPGWKSGFDLDPEQAIATRRTLLQRAVAEDMSVMAFHFPFPSVGRVAARSEGGWEWTPGAGEA
jgi:glyoxylase-like metal-dependent hydrolase (beta-lactamase superfamily II)